MARTLTRLVTLGAIALVPIGVMEAERDGWSLNTAGARVVATTDDAVNSVRTQLDRASQQLRAAIGQANSGGTDSVVPWDSQSGADGSTTAGVPEVTGTAIKSQAGAVMIRTVTTSGEGAGSGIVWKSDGTIVTNYHVVKGSTQIQVTTADGEKHTASLVGYDATKDVAVLKTTDKISVTAATFDTTPERGESVNAVGQGGGQGVLYRASGTIVALNQSISAATESDSSETEKLSGLIQINAPIVAGYSGGPLFDADGEVIGMDTAASSSTPIQGFAITSADMLGVATDILNGTKTSTNQIGRHGALGIRIAATTAEEGGAGVQVTDVVAGQAADKVGLQAGDTITAFAGESVTSATSLTTKLSTHDAGEKVALGWTDTNGVAHTATVTLSEAGIN